MNLQLLAFTALLSFSFPTLGYAQTSTTTQPATQTEALIDSLHLLTQAIKEVIDNNKVSAERMEQLTDAIFRAVATLDSSARLKAEATGGFDWQVFWTATGVLITAAGFLFVWLQLRFNAWLKAQEIFTDPDFRKAGGVVLPHYWQPDKEWTDADKKKALVCAKMDELARLIPFIREKKALESWDDPFGKCWYVLQDFIEEERNKTKWLAKWKAFEDLGKKAYARVQQREKEYASLQLKK